ncbi:hypothetical protein TVAG_237340 [Trichomonas vaginalis G3]|uniref:Uncharacterized protein n=1 Tax=Trichomonas vaginalis (strain ATCC PRA-98 / G3) TaxID=412133 RepID=A2DCT4_TRIV3|nr:hypothetical protein TVAG_237340 [Trichomonas vaginalis G3]|eukprot:XP_001582694.1 hypothetical protein [Trichomonas vaginalis G3]
MKSAYEKWTPSVVSSQLQEIGLGNYAQEFVKQDIYGEVLPMLQDKHLKALGMNLIGHRIQFLRFVKSLTGNTPETKAEPKRSSFRENTTSNSVTTQKRATPTQQHDEYDDISPRFRSGSNDRFDNSPYGIQNSRQQNTRNQQPKKPAYSAYEPVEEEEEEEDTGYHYKPYARDTKKTTPFQSTTKKTYDYNKSDSDDDNYGNFNKRPTQARPQPKQTYDQDFDEMDEDAVFNRKPKQNPNQITSSYVNQRSNERFNQGFGNSHHNNFDDDEEEEEKDNYRNDYQQRYGQAQQKQTRQPYKPQPKQNQFANSSDDEQEDNYYNNRPPSRSTSRSQPAPVPQENPPSPYADDNVELVECSICGRRFAADRIQKHEEICRKSATKKKKVFDITSKRLADTGAEEYIGQIKAAKDEKPKPKNEVPKYKKEHEKLVEAMRNARKIQQYEKDVAAGKNVKPPELAPIQMDDDDRVTCPICGRKFGKEALARHTPGCEKMNARKLNTRGRR